MLLGSILNQPVDPQVTVSPEQTHQQGVTAPTPPPDPPWTPHTRDYLLKFKQGFTGWDLGGIFKHLNDRNSSQYRANWLVLVKGAGRPHQCSRLSSTHI